MNTFIRKVVAERKVLNAINSRIASRAQLSGLSLASIETWQHNACAPKTDQVTMAIMELAQLCQRLSDRSNESFTSLDPEIMSKIDERIINLEQLLDSL